MNRAIFANTVSEVLEANLVGENIELNGLNLCHSHSDYSNIISYVTSSKYIDICNQNKNIALLILTEELLVLYQENIGRKISYITSDKPESDFYKFHNYLVNKTDFYKDSDFDIIIGQGCKIHETSIIERGVIIGENVTIGANSVICKNSIIRDDVSIGMNTVIGSDGFQIIRIADHPVNITHVGGVLIDKNVYISDNCSINKSLFEGFTYIGENVQIAQQVTVSHNCIVEKGSVITSGVVLCGSVRIEENCWIGVNSSVLNRVNIGANSIIGIGSTVVKNIDKNSIVYGNAANKQRDNT